MTTATARLSAIFAGLSGAVGVVAGAWASHAGASLDADGVRLVEIGARYQLLHAVGLLCVAGLSVVWPGRLPRLAAFLFIAGTILFSGSLYALALTDYRMLGMVTPVGGFALVTGWLLLAIHGAVRPR